MKKREKAEKPTPFFLRNILAGNILAAEHTCRRTYLPPNILAGNILAAAEQDHGTGGPAVFFTDPDGPAAAYNFFPAAEMPL